MCPRRDPRPRLLDDAFELLCVVRRVFLSCLRQSVFEYVFDCDEAAQGALVFYENDSRAAWGIVGGYQ